jgi:opacity protein-like surface antigen
MGVELSYNNNPTITLINPEYQINQTVTSTVMNNATTGTGGTTSYPAPSTVRFVQAPVTLNSLSLKVVNVPLHLTMQYFPVYDGYFQPFLKAGIGLNLTHTDMTLAEDLDSATRGTLMPLYQTGWAFKPFTYTYGAGVHIMLTDSLSLSFSYLKQKLDGRSTKFKVMINDPNDSNRESGTPSVNGTYGDMRFEFQQKTTLKEIGLAYYF